MPSLNHNATAFFKLLGGDDSGQAKRLRIALNNLDGVLEVKFNFVLDTIFIAYDSGIVNRDQIKSKVDWSNKGLGRGGTPTPSLRPSKRRQLHFLTKNTAPLYDKFKVEGR